MTSSYDDNNDIDLTANDIFTTMNPIHSIQYTIHSSIHHDLSQGSFSFLFFLKFILLNSALNNGLEK